MDCPPAIIFTYYRETAKLLADLIQVPLVIGGQKNNAQIAKQASHEAQTIVANIDALQEGLDLSAGFRAVIFYEPEYLPGKTTQATMRVHRSRPDGTSDPVLLYWIIARASIDERILKVSKDRGATSNQIMGLEMQAA